MKEKGNQKKDNALLLLLLQIKFISKRSLRAGNIIESLIHV